MFFNGASLIVRIPEIPIKSGTCTTAVASLFEHVEGMNVCPHDTLSKNSVVFVSSAGILRADVSCCSCSCLPACYNCRAHPTRGQELPALTRHEEHDWKDVDCVFCCLPHATTQEIISQLPEHLKARDG